MSDSKLRKLPTIVEILLFNEFHLDLTDIAKSSFSKHISGRIWTLMESGSILNASPKETEGKGSIVLVIDIDDEATVRTFNKLPKYFDRRQNCTDLMEMQLSVMVKLDEDEKYPYWPEENDTDKIIFDDRGMYLESVKGVADAQAMLSAN